MKEETKKNMIEKSELYSEPKVYIFGYCDGYKKAIEECKSKEIFDFILEVREICVDMSKFEQVWKIDKLLKEYGTK